ncbi:hypothetical protein, conserved [Eimeria tenella]|uniref:VHS domain-containing protein n=1 Tax=Eimeria tenella TaxID=5802 RepID=U6KTT7_EIMTE|nr:hypothetical protein, conserved [Eimeria tenella]CDJ39799.1 hypothetical protein, conserved [Eimeria tenella]|eukprot:XP_013230552.1 hypothetical protein, conserved [Eimeria tenella]
MAFEGGPPPFPEALASCLAYHGGPLELNAALAMQCVDACSSSSSSSSYLLDPEGMYRALELVEICVKNNGLDFARHMDEHFLRSMAKVLKITTFKRSLTKDVKDKINKIIGGPFVHPGVATDPRIHKLKRKVLFMFQLWHDSFVLQQERCPAIFAMYRKLRSKGVEFPQVDRSHKFFVKNAEVNPSPKP